jgi:hypothetical protein
MAIFYSDSGSLRDLKVTGSTLMTTSTGIALQVKSSGSTIFSVSGSGGEIFNISDVGSSTALFTVASASTNILNVDNTKNVSISGSLIVTGSAYLRGLGTTTQTSIVTIDTSTGQLYTTASSALSVTIPTPTFIATGSVTASVNVGSTMFQITSASVTRTSMTNLGIQTWVLNSGVSESGIIAYSTPQGNPGIIFGTSGSGIDTSTFLNRFNFAVSSAFTYLGYGGVTSFGSFAIFSGSNNINIGYTGTPTDTGYRLLVTGSGTSGSFNANNILFVSGSTVSISGSFTVVSSSTEFQVLGTGVKMGNSTADIHTVTGSLSVDNTLYVTQSRVGIITGGTLPASALQVNGGILVGQSGSNQNQAITFIRNDGFASDGLKSVGGGTIQVGGANINFVDIHAANASVARFSEIISGPATPALNLKGPLFVSGAGYAGTVDYMLDITGSGDLGSFNANNTLFVSGSRVGIGTPTPKAYLEINLSGSTGQTPIIISGSAPTAGAIMQVDMLGAGGGVGNLIRVNDSTSNPTTNYFILKANSNNYRGFEQSYYESTARFGILGAPFTGLAIYSGLATEVARFAANAGNLLLNKTSDSGQRLQVAGTTLMSSSVNVLTVQGSGSSAPLFTVQGSQGELFSVTDSLTGSLFSVNDISGLPIVDVRSDQTTLIGSYLAPGLYASTRVTANTGITVICSIPTASYDSAYFDYNIRSGSVGRAGSIIAMWSGNSVNYNEVSASSFGTTNTFVFGVSISGSNMILSGSAPSNGWIVKTIIKAI